MWQIFVNAAGVCNHVETLSIGFRKNKIVFDAAVTVGEDAQRCRVLFHIRDVGGRQRLEKLFSTYLC